MLIPKLLRDLAKRAVLVISPFYAIPEGLIKAIRNILHGYHQQVGTDVTGREHALCAAIAATAGIVWAIHAYLTVWKPNRFFGMDLDRRLMIVMPTFTTREQHIGYKVNVHGEEESKVMHRWVAYPSGHARYVQRAIARHREFEHANTIYAVDESFFSLARQFSTDSLLDRTISVLVMGSSSSNLVCAVLMNEDVFCSPMIYVFDRIEDFKATPHPDSGYRLVPRLKENHPSTDLGTVLEESDDLDWAVVFRIVYDGTVFFTCAGLGEEGTNGGLSFLFDNWRSLAAQTGNRDFYALLRVRKLGLGAEKVLFAIKSDTSHKFEICA